MTTRVAPASGSHAACATICRTRLPSNSAPPEPAPARGPCERAGGVLPGLGRLDRPRVPASLYRLLYDGALSRPPEPTAIAFGQTLLRALPGDALPMFRLEDP